MDEIEGAVAAQEAISINETIEIPDSWFTIDEEGTGIARFKISLADDSGVEALSNEVAVTRDFDTNAIKLLSKVSKAEIDGSDKITVKPLDVIDIPVRVTGADSNEYDIVWKSNNDNVKVAEDGSLYASVNNGKSILTGYVVPKDDKIIFNPDGTIANPDRIEHIPSYLVKTVNAYVTVDDGSKKPSGGGGGGSKATPTPTPSAEPTPEPTVAPSSWYTDVPQNEWYYDAVKYVTDNNLMNGTSDTTFEPLSEVTRGMFATVLFRQNGSIQADLIMPFEDVPEGEYYAAAVRWAAAAKVVNGTSETTFEPDKLITREEMAAMLYRYIQYKGGGFEGDWAFPLDYPDKDQVSDWAYEAMCYLTMPSVGLIKGMEDGTLQPKANTNRAELATILMRYCEEQKAE